jgi:elongator complex protein 1
MCAVRAVLPRPANAVAWLDGDVAADLDASEEALAAAPVNATAKAAAQAGVDVVQQGLCEVLAVLLSDGQIVFLRAVESDLWEETLEDQEALGGPCGYLLPLGYCPAADAPSSTVGGTVGVTGGGTPGSTANGFLSMPVGPWTPLDGSSTSSAPTSRPGQQQQVHQQQQQRLLPVKHSAEAQEPGIPLAEGRLVLGLVWTSRSSLLLLAAPYPAEEGLEEGEGTVLIQVSVQIPSDLFTTAAAAAAATGGLGPAGSASVYQAGPEVVTAMQRVSYAGGQVIAAAAHPAGGALLQLQHGPALYYSADGQLPQLQGQAALGSPCRTIRVLPNAPAGAGTAAANRMYAANAHSAAGKPSSSSSGQRAAAVASLAPALGLTAHGALYWGSKLLASDVTSFALRGGGPGGPAVLFVTRQALLYVVMVSQLPSYVHTLVRRRVKRRGKYKHMAGIGVRRTWELTLHVCRYGRPTGKLRACSGVLGVC